VEKPENLENEKHICRTWNKARNTEKREKLEKHIVGPGLWRETLKHLEKK
jgi:hypothetical protein